MHPIEVDMHHELPGNDTESQENVIVSRFSPSELQAYAEARASEVEDIDINELIDLVKDGAKWMQEQLASLPAKSDGETNEGKEG